ncbi:hypothetical protein FSP39_014186 [Pinctada imbricata]|uniref:THAP-type domain-containing protein n=1 Tax=Pinctada imbricata TaxID=66713 RepID=A0AA88YU27_PINIB|nr:hypothetical protein FSP39_014186 [Pinctada imbricata]
MPHHCCVPHCTSNSAKTGKDVSFHTFPRDPVVSKKWIVAIRRDVGKDFRVNKETRVCSLHFEKSDYFPTTELHTRKVLRGGSCPSIFYWTKQTSARRALCRVVPKKRKVDTASLKVETLSATSRSPECEPASSLDEMPESNSSDDSLTQLEDAESPSKAELKQKNLSLLHLRSKEKFSILRFCNSDADIKFYTGFSSYSGLHNFFTFLQPACNFLYYIGTENTSQGTPYAMINKRGPTRSLSPMEELFVTLVRLRKNFPEKLIGDLYNLSEGHMSKILNTWIIFLSDRLGSLPIWPNREQVQKTMPQIFRQYYPTTRVIVDCTEIFIGHPSAAECQRETFSTYKHHNTAKGLIGIAPSGQITFISSLYAGRCSDKKIVRHCGILDLIEEGDGLMVDRGFDISPDLETRGAKLIMPSFLSGQNQFTTTQLVDSRNIATVRVHVERAVRKVKEFEILKSVPITLCPMLEKIWNVCGHLANFTGTLFNNPN